MSIVGHDEQIAAFAAALGGARLHHAWLLAGPRGIGKASFAAIAAHLYLEGGGVDPFVIDRDSSTARLIAAGSHPDYALLERIERLDKDGEPTGDRARNISVDQVRGLARLFGTTPTFSPRRAVVIDAIDDMEPSAANALLKSLEEPPAETLFLIVSHSPGRLLPTIRSRCRVLRFQPLDDDVMTSLLRSQLDDVSPEEIAAVSRAADGAPGRAIALAGLGVAAMDKAMDAIVATGDPDNRLRADLARNLAGKAAQARYELLLERLPARIASEARTGAGSLRMRAIDNWERARDIAGRAVALSLEPQATIFDLCGLLAALAPAGAGPSRS